MHSFFQMNNIAKLSLNSPARRLNSSINIWSATGRDFEHREKIEKLSRKAVHDQEEMGIFTCFFSLFKIFLK